MGVLDQTTAVGEFMDVRTGSGTVLAEATSSGPSVPVLGLVENTQGCYLYTFFCRVFLETFLVMLGLVGNSLTIRILWHDRNKSSTLFLLVCLATADSLVLLAYGGIAMPPAYLRFMGRAVEAQRLEVEIIRYFSPCGATSMMMSLGLTVAVTFQRYISVCMPYRAKIYGSLRIAKILALSVVICSLLFNFPRWFEYTVVYDKPAPGFAILAGTRMYKNRTYEIIYGVTLYYLMFYILPMGALAYMTFALIRALHQAKLKRQEMTGGNMKKNQAKEELTLSLVVVVIVFMICQFFGPARRILLIFFNDSVARQCGGVLFYFEAMSMGAYMTNSAVNFIIYVVCNKRFRKQMKDLCFCTLPKVHPAMDGSTGHNTDSIHINAQSYSMDNND